MFVHLDAVTGRLTALDPTPKAATMLTESQGTGAISAPSSQDSNAYAWTAHLAIQTSAHPNALMEHSILESSAMTITRSTAMDAVRLAE